MTWETFTLIIIQLVTPFILFFLLKNYLPAYFTEKGKNLATKEDVEEITEKIKNVESKINIRASGEIDYNSLKRKIVLDYFGAYNNWERLVVSNNSHYGNDCEIKNDSLIEKMNDAKFNYNLKEGEIEIFINDRHFYELTSDITTILYVLQHQFELHCVDVNTTVKTESELEVRFEKLKLLKEQLFKQRCEKQEELVLKRILLIEFLEKTLKESFN